MIRIAFFTHYADLYGANRSLLDLVRHLRHIGAVDPFIMVATEGPLIDALDREGIDHAVIPFSTWMAKRVYMGRPHHRFLQWLGYRKASRSRRFSDRSLLPSLEKLLRDRRIDLLHVNSSVIGIGHLLKQRMKLPLVWHVRELVFKHYGLHPDTGMKGFQQAVRSADRVIAISNAVKDELAITVGSKNVVVIYNGIIDDEDGQVRSKALNRPIRTPFTFTLMGYFHKSKGQVEAIKAFAGVWARYPDIKLLIAGSGNDAEIRRTVGSMGIASAVEFAGFVNDPDKIYKRTSVLLNCSRFEALGRVTIEAMFHGIPVIGHASGATPEIIRHGINGFLYHTMDELIASMIKMTGQPALTAEMGAAAFDSLGDRFSIQARTKDVLDLYKEVMAKRQ